MVFGDKIVVQERDETHTILFLLDGPFIEDRIDFSQLRHNGKLGLNRRSAPNYQEYKWGRQPDSLILQDREVLISHLWNRGKETSVVIDKAGLPWNKAPDYFNCRSGVVGCLWAMGLLYVDPLRRAFRKGAQPNFLRHGINIFPPVQNSVDFSVRNP